MAKWYEILQAGFRFIVRDFPIASLAPYVGGPWVAEYTAAKGGIVGLNMAAAKELGRTGINVNAIAPGYINTPMTDKLFTEFL